MENQNLLEKLAAQIGQHASAKTVFGEPVTVGEKTVIPVAQIAYGFGGGFGQGRKKDEKQVPAQNPDGAQAKEDSVLAEGDGGGGGGGMLARAKGVYEITPSSTRFIPITRTRSILIGVGIGFVLRGLFFKQSKKR